MSPADDYDGKYSGNEDDAEHGSNEAGPVVYTKTGRISKAKKGLKVHICEECGRSFTRAEHLRRHQKNHGPNQVRCELCGKVFFRADLLQRHLERHKELIQGYRTNNPFAGTTEDASLSPADEAPHRHILPAPVHLSDHSSSSYTAPSGFSDAPTPSQMPTASPVITQHPHHMGEKANDQPVKQPTMEEQAPQRKHAWQAVNSQDDRNPNSSDTPHFHVSSPSLSQQSHPSLPKLQPKNPSGNNNGASNDRRYSNILPAPGTPNAQNQHAAHPQAHKPNLLPTRFAVASTQAVVSQATAIPNQLDQGPPMSPMAIASRSPTVASSVPRTGLSSQLTQGLYQLGLESSTPPVAGDAPKNTPGSLPTRNSEMVLPKQHESGARDLVQGIPKSSIKQQSRRCSSDDEGVNWTVAGTGARPFRKRKHHLTASEADGDSSGVDETSGYRTPLDAAQRSHPGIRSLSLVTPQDDRDHALLGTTYRDGQRSSEVMPSLKVPHMTSSPAAFVGPNPISRPSTRNSDSHLSPTARASGHGKNASGSESPEPESPYSLATINRFIKNQRPQTGANQDEQLDHQDLRIQPDLQASMTACERCREYSIKCDGRLPECTACATTKYAEKCSFASMALQTAVPTGPSVAPTGTGYYDDMTTMTRNEMAEPQGHLLAPPAGGGLHSDQGYSSEEDLPSPYLKPRDREEKSKGKAQVPSAPVESVPGAKKRKVSEQHEVVTEMEVDDRHARKRSKGSLEVAKGSGKDIVDMLLTQWSVPAR